MWVTEARTAARQALPSSAISWSLPRFWRQVVTLSTQEVAGRVQEKTASGTRKSVRLFISLTRAFGTCLKLHLVSLKGAVASTFAFPWGASGSIRTVWRLSQSSQISDVTFYRIGCLGYFVTGFIIVIWFFFSSPFAPTTFLFFFSKSLLVDGYSLPSALPPYTYWFYILGLFLSPLSI